MASPKNQASTFKKGKSQEQGASSMVPGLEVTAILHGFSRAGLVWSDRPITVKLSELTEDQIAEIKRCPGLTVKEVEIEDDQPDDTASDAETIDSESQGESE